jgi:hypothetical protein
VAGHRGAHALAWRANRFGGPEVLELTDIAVPEPGHEEVVIDVRAAVPGLLQALLLTVSVARGGRVRWTSPPGSGI